MSNQQPSGRRAKYLPSDLQHGPAVSFDPSSSWSSDTSICPHCGDVFHAAPGGRPLQPNRCNSCGKNATSSGMWMILSIPAYFIVLLLFYPFHSEAFEDGLLGPLAILGFFALLGMLVKIGMLSKERMKPKVMARIAALRVERAQRPEDVELLGKLFTLYQFVEEREHALTLAEQALLLDPDNANIKAQVQKYRSGLEAAGVIPVAGVAENTPNPPPIEAQTSQFFSPEDKMIIAKIEVWQEKGFGKQRWGVVLIAVAVVLGVLSQIVTFIMNIHVLWGWIPSVALASVGLKMAITPISFLPPGVTPPAGYVVPNKKHAPILRIFLCIFKE